jgi:hypothetical protein
VGLLSSLLVTEQFKPCGSATQKPNSAERRLHKEGFRLLREASRGWKNGEEWQRFGLDFEKSERGKVGLFKGAFGKRRAKICYYSPL